MVFYRLSDSGLPIDCYGFDFKGTKREETDDLHQIRLPQETIDLLDKSDSNNHKVRSFTHRFILGQYEYEGVHIVGGESLDERNNVVARLFGTFFNREKMCDSLFEIADSLSQETLDYHDALFDGCGRPKGAWKKKLKGVLFPGSIKMLYINL